MQLDRLSRLVLVTSLLATSLTLPAFADHRDGVTLYTDAEFRGASQTFHDDVDSLQSTRFGNDRASSVRVDPGCVVTLYSDSGFRGRSFTLTNDTYTLHNTPVGNDAVSSLEIDCRRRFGGDVDWNDRPGVALYSDAGFDGRREVFYQDDSDLRNNRIGNDAVSSVRVAPGCTVTLYSDRGFRGRAATFSYDADRLGGTPIGNDSVSSLSVECDRRRGRRQYNQPRNDRDPQDRGGVTLFHDAGFRGRNETFYNDVHDLGRTPIGNDSVSSILVSPGCRVVLYREGDFRGEPVSVRSDIPDLGRTRIGNDALSSIEVNCRRRR